MAGFGDFLQAIQFGVGLASGFATQAQEERKANEASQLQLLQLLQKSDQYEIESLETAPPQAGGILGTLFGATTPGTFNVGGQHFRATKTPPYVVPPSITESLTGNIPAQKTSEIFESTYPQAQEILAEIPSVTLPRPVSALAKPATQNYAELAAQIARREGVPEQLIPAFVANIEVESQFNPQARSSKGAMGLAQLMQDTALRYNVKDTFDPVQSLMGGARYWRDLSSQFNNDPDLIAAAYNAGEGAVEEHGGIPPFRETQAHVKRVRDLTSQYAQFAQVQPGIIDIAPGAGEPALPKVEVAPTDARGLDAEQLESIRATLRASETQYRAAEAQISKRRQRQALVAANTAKLIAEKHKLVKEAVQANREVTTKERKVLGEMYKMPIPPWVRTPATVAKFHDLMENFDPDLHASEIKRIASQRIAQAVQTGDAAEIQKVVPVLTSRMTSRHFSKADIDEVKEVSGYKAWEAGQQAGVTRRATEQVDKETIKRTFADAQHILAGETPDKEERAFVLQSAAGIPENRMLPATQSYIARKKALEVPSATTDLPNRVARETGLPNFAAATPGQAKIINAMVEDRQKTARLDEREQTITIQNDLKRHERDITEVPAEKLQYYLERTTLRPFTQVITWKELRDRNPIPVTPKVLDDIREFAPLRALSSEVKYLVDKVYGPDGPLKSIALDKGIKGRLTGRATVLIEQLRNHPDVRQLDERLREWGVQAARALEGLRGRPAYQLMKPALDVRPSLGDAGFLGFGGRMPDTKETILAQVEGGERVVNRMISEILSVSVGNMPIAGQTPAWQAPAGQAPAGQAPAGQAPAWQAPAWQAPALSLMERMRQQAQPRQAP